MKTFSIAIAVLALMAASLPVRANVHPSSNPINLCTKAVESKKIVVQITNMEKKPTALTLMSTYGEVYYRDLIREHNGHRALLDLEKLPEGRYILHISQKGEKRSQVIRITEERVLVSHCEQ